MQMENFHLHVLKLVWDSEMKLLIRGNSSGYRVREFDLAEIEHFFDPEDPSHPKY